MMAVSCLAQPRLWSLTATRPKLASLRSTRCLDRRRASWRAQAAGNGQGSKKLLELPLKAPSKEWSEELLKELGDSKQLGKRGELWFVAQSVGILLLVFPPAGLRALVDGAGGFTALLAGFVMLILGQQALGESLTPLPQPRESSELVTGGIYQYVRHPMYGGLLLAGVGLALVTGDELRLLLAAALFLVLDRKASYEEELLVERYGEDYKQMMARTKKLIPWLY